MFASSKALTEGELCRAVVPRRRFAPKVMGVPITGKPQKGGFPLSLSVVVVVGQEWRGRQLLKRMLRKPPYCGKSIQIGGGAKGCV